MRIAREEVAELTVKSVTVGVLLGIVFGAANAYLGLRVGLTISASIPAAVMTVAVFRAMRGRGTILEANLSQTIGSASTSLASGTIFTIPALFLWGMAPPYLQVVALCFLGGVLGLTAMIPLRRLLIVREHAELPFPEGTACAQVLRATTTGTRSGTWVFRGMAVGAGVKLLASVAFLVPGAVHVALPLLRRAEVGLELAPALLGVGFILGFRQSAVLVAGSIVSALALTPLIAYLGSSLPEPLYPETTKLVSEMSAGEIWQRYVRYIGAGAVAAAGILTVVRNSPTMGAAFASVVRGLRRGGAAGSDAGADRRDRDLPAWAVACGVGLVVLATFGLPGVLAGDPGPVQRAVCAAGVAFFGLLFVAVAARIVGIVGVTSQPTSGITLVTLLGIASIFAAAGWTDTASRAAVLTAGTLVAIAASKAGDISQDLKTGFLVGATPARQQLGQLVGAAFACWAVAGTVLLLGSAYTFGSKDLAAPQATLMKTVIEGVLSGELPWDLVLTGIGISIAATLCGVSGLAFAIGVYLPLASMLPIFVGGCVRAWVLGRSAGGARDESDPGILAASGLVAGEGLAGVAVAAAVATGWLQRSREPHLPGELGEAAALVAVGFVGAFLYRAGRTRREAATRTTP
jgi:putative OPT family oligopeptide transporter